MNVSEWLDDNFNKEHDTVLITGATSGIGYEYLQEFSKHCCNAIIVSNEKERLEQIKQDFADKYGVTIFPLYCDLSSFEAVCGLLDAIRNFKIKVLVNNAGFGLKGDFLTNTRCAYRDILAVNSLAPTMITHAVLPQMREQNCGLIIHVASVNVVSPIPKNAVYTATKSYLFSYSLALSHENKAYNILFQTLLPGTTDTPFHDKQGVKPQAMMMTPDRVVKASLQHIDQLVVLPNRMDRVLYPIVTLLPIKWKMNFTAYMVKKRLGV